VREAVAAVAPARAGGRIQLSPEVGSVSEPTWCVGTAVVDRSLVVKFAWSAPAAERVAREAEVLAVLARAAPDLPVPQLEGTSADPVAFATRFVGGKPLRLDAAHVPEIAFELGAFLDGLHRAPVLDEMRRAVRGLVEPNPQATTEAIRERLPRFLDGRRAALLPAWCDWVDGILRRGSARTVFVHGDLHAFNQVWSPAGSLRLVADFEVAGPGDPEYDFRYFPQMSATLDFVHALQRSYGHPVDVSRVLAWSIRTALGDALWRSEAGIALPFGNTPASYVDDIARKLRLAGAYG